LRPARGGRPRHLHRHERLLGAAPVPDPRRPLGPALAPGGRHRTAHPRRRLRPRRGARRPRAPPVPRRGAVDDHPGVRGVGFLNRLMNISYLMCDPGRGWAERAGGGGRTAAPGSGGIGRGATPPRGYTIDALAALTRQHRLPVVSLLSGWSYANEG